MSSTYNFNQNFIMDKKVGLDWYSRQNYLIVSPTVQSLMSALCRLHRKWLLHWMMCCTSEDFSQNRKFSFLIKFFPLLLSRLCLDCSLCCNHHIMVMTIVTSTSNYLASAEGCSVQTNHTEVPPLLLRTILEPVLSPCCCRNIES